MVVALGLGSTEALRESTQARLGRTQLLQGARPRPRALARTTSRHGSRAERSSGRPGCSAKLQGVIRRDEARLSDVFVAPELVFVHIPRTGGTFVRTLLADHLAADPKGPTLAAHAAYEELPPELRGRPVFCLVRNPWDWYVSWYHYVMSRGPRLSAAAKTAKASGVQNVAVGEKVAIWRSAFGNGRNDFRETVTNACEGRIQHSDSHTMRKADIDYYSRLVQALAGAGIARGEIDVGRFESIRPFLLEFLERYDLLSDSLQEAVEGRPALRTSQHAAYRDYYNGELRDLVAHKARAVIQAFGYTF